MFDFLKKKAKKSYTSLSAATLQEYNKHRPLGPQKLVCHAPFKSIYFGYHGNVVACCYNRDYPLGQYPAMSVKEIWTGQRAEQLREYIRVNDLTLGCAHCETQLLTGNFDAVKSKQYDFNKLNSNGYPSVMEFELSNTCNLECVMCNGNFSSLIRAKREKLPSIKDVYDAEFVNQLQEFIPYLEEMKFYGGEPFLIEIYYGIWELVKKLNPKIRLTVQTNGMVLNSRVKEIMENTNFNIYVSLDSLQKENYERIRKNADFDKVMENIKYFYNYCKSRNTSFGISVCGMQQNWGEMPDFINYCNELEIPIYIHTVFDPPANTLSTLPPEQLKTIVEYLQKFDFPANSPVKKKNKTHYNDFVAQVMAWGKNGPKIPDEIRVKPMDELHDRLIQHISTSVYINAAEKATKIAAVAEKFKAFESSPKYEIIKSVLAHMSVKDYDSRDITIGYIEKYSVDELLEIAKAQPQK